MAEDTQTQPQQEPITVNLSLNLQQVYFILTGLNELKTGTGVWPLTQYIQNQVQSQVPQEQPTDTPASPAQ
jgi:hypothetical protein